MAISPVPHRPHALSIAIVGTGIAGMSAAWLLSQRHNITVYEKDDRLGGHTNTVTVNIDGSKTPVDTGFIVYNERNYPNLVALFDHLDVKTRATEMSFGASLDGGRFEYSGKGVGGLLAQPRNLLRPRLWSLLRDVKRFYREAPLTLGARQNSPQILGEFLEKNGYGKAFVHDHLLPMGAAIWSTPPRDMLDYPLEAFVRFMKNHGLLSIKDRPVWRTVEGGSRQYLHKLTAAYKDRVRLNTGVCGVSRFPDHVLIEDRQGGMERYDHVVIATHGDQALGMLADPYPLEKRLLGAFRYERNLAVLHTDDGLMPRSRRAWSSWNFMSSGRGNDQQVSVTYWMNRLQHIPEERPRFVSLNPLRQPAPGKILRTFPYEHPLFNQEAIAAQRSLWKLQGVRRTWYCGAYLGHGFHEDALQAGLAVAEQLGGLRRPWDLETPNSRIFCPPGAAIVDTRGQAA